jgi:hypothetical protein
VIRPVESRDFERVKQLAIGADWEIDESMFCGLVLVNEADEPMIFAGAWMLAEVHVAVDRAWSTPAVRLHNLKQIHDAMQKQLRLCGVGQAVTWFDNTRNRFLNRLETWGWVKSQKTSWHREII